MPSMQLSPSAQQAPLQICSAGQHAPAMHCSPWLGSQHAPPQTFAGIQQPALVHTWKWVQQSAPQTERALQQAPPTQLSSAAQHVCPLSVLHTCRIGQHWLATQIWLLGQVVPPQGPPTAMHVPPAQVVPPGQQTPAQGAEPSGQSWKRGVWGTTTDAGCDTAGDGNGALPGVPPPRAGRPVPPWQLPGCTTLPQAPQFASLLRISAQPLPQSA
jgi:hypothetical protein